MRSSSLFKETLLQWLIMIFNYVKIVESLHNFYVGFYLIVFLILDKTEQCKTV